MSLLVDTDSQTAIFFSNQDDRCSVWTFGFFNNSCFQKVHQGSSKLFPLAKWYSAVWFSGRDIIFQVYFVALQFGLGLYRIHTTSWRGVFAPVPFVLLLSVSYPDQTYCPHSFVALLSAGIKLLTSLDNCAQVITDFGKMVTDLLLLLVTSTGILNLATPEGRVTSPGVTTSPGWLGILVSNST